MYLNSNMGFFRSTFVESLQQFWRDLVRIISLETYISGTYAEFPFKNSNEKRVSRLRKHLQD